MVLVQACFFTPLCICVYGVAQLACAPAPGGWRGEVKGSRQSVKVWLNFPRLPLPISFLPLNKWCACHPLALFHTRFPQKFLHVAHPPPTVLLCRLTSFAQSGWFRATTTVWLTVITPHDLLSNYYLISGPKEISTVHYGWMCSLWTHQFEKFVCLCRKNPLFSSGLERNKSFNGLLNVYYYTFIACCSVVRIFIFENVYECV